MERNCPYSWLLCAFTKRVDDADDVATRDMRELEGYGRHPATHEKVEHIERARQHPDSHPPAFGSGMSTSVYWRHSGPPWAVTTPACIVIMMCARGGQGTHPPGGPTGPGLAWYSFEFVIQLLWNEGPGPLRERVAVDLRRAIERQPIDELDYSRIGVVRPDLVKKGRKFCRGSPAYYSVT